MNFAKLFYPFFTDDGHLSTSSSADEQARKFCIWCNTLNGGAAVILHTLTHSTVQLGVLQVTCLPASRLPFPAA